jgi:hypothetical protein
MGGLSNSGGLKNAKHLCAKRANDNDIYLDELAFGLDHAGSVQRRNSGKLQILFEYCSKPTNPTAGFFATA